MWLTLCQRLAKLQTTLFWGDHATIQLVHITAIQMFQTTYVYKLSTFFLLLYKITLSITLRVVQSSCLHHNPFSSIFGVANEI